MLGTSADPPTVGHRAVLAGLLNRYGQVAHGPVTIPFNSTMPPWRCGSDAARGAVVDSLSEQAGSEQLELRQDFSSRRAIDSIEAARRCFPEDEPVFVVGNRSGATNPPLVRR